MFAGFRREYREDNVTSTNANLRASLRALPRKVWADLLASGVLTLLFLLLCDLLVFVAFLKLSPPQYPAAMANSVVLVWYITVSAWWILSYVFVCGSDHARVLHSIAVSASPPLFKTAIGLVVPGYLMIEKFAEVSLGTEIGLPAWLMPRVFGIDPVQVSWVGWGLLFGVCFAVFFLAAITLVYAKAGHAVELRSEENRRKEGKPAFAFRHRLVGDKTSSAVALGSKANAVAAFRYKLIGYVVMNIVLLVAMLAGLGHAETVTLTARDAPASDKTVSVCFKDKSRIDGELILTTDKIVVFKTATSLEAYPHDQISHASCAEFTARQGVPTSVNTSIVFFRELSKQQQEPVTDR